MLRALAPFLLVAVGGCSSILGIPSEGEVGCPAPCTVTVSGRTVRAESPSDVLPGVMVRLGDTTVTSDSPNANYSFPGIAPATALQFNLIYTPGGGEHAPPQMSYQLGTTAMDDISLDLPVVSYPWLASVISGCGIMSDADAQANAAGYLATRSTVLVQVQNEDGSPGTAFDRNDITVFLKNAMSGIDFANPNPADADAFPAKVCFLELNTATGAYEGRDEANSASGRFIVFRVVNDRGTGTGVGHVDIPGFPSGPLNLSAGTVGFTVIKKGTGTPVPPRKLSFARDVYHFFHDDTSKYMCITCHFPGGAADPPVTPRMNGRLGPDGMTYYADWVGNTTTVYTNLMLNNIDPIDPNFPSDCDTVPARVCLKKPDASLFFRNPTGMASHSGQVDLTADDPFMKTVLQWITDGAQP